MVYDWFLGPIISLNRWKLHTEQLETTPYLTVHFVIAKMYVILFSNSVFRRPVLVAYLLHLLLPGQHKMDSLSFWHIHHTFSCPLRLSINITHMINCYSHWKSHTKIRNKDKREIIINLPSQRSFTVLVCILTVCLGMGGSPDGLFGSTSSLRMWSVLMYESYRPSPCRAEGDKAEQNKSVEWCRIIKSLIKTHTHTHKGKKPDDGVQRSHLKNTI